jgi:hypothetical protein
VYIAHSFSTMFGRASIPSARIAHVRLTARELHSLASALAIEAEGEDRYSPIIEFASKEVRARFSNAVIEALLVAYPGALS